MCSAATNLASGIINGILYTKRNSSQITITNADTTCTSSVTTLLYMFQDAISFNQPLNNWNTSLVTNMSGMFNNANNFNQDLSNWDAGLVTDWSWCSAGATSWSQPHQFNGLGTC